MFLDISLHPLYKVFLFWIQQVLKLINFMDTIYIFPNISLWDTMIAIAIIDVIIYIVKLGINYQNSVRWFDNQLRYYDDNNPKGYKSFGKYRR